MTPPTAAIASSRPRWLTWVATFVATGFGSGFAPIAPGTAGSLVGLLLYWPLRHLSPAAFVTATAAVFLVGVVASAEVARSTGCEDPGRVVVDEIVGMWTSLAFLPFTPVTAAAGFVLFRIMDVVKPYPARSLEDLPGGWGIMSDDLMAGIYANLVLRIALLVIPA
jgi:phosphatidylglycerophosphatase A